MRKLISLIGVGVAAIGLSVATAPASAVTIRPGPVKVVLPQASEPGDMRPGTTSQLFITPSYVVDLAARGPIVWRGRVYQGGRLKFPASKQTWPDSIITSPSIKHLRGKIHSDGLVRLTGVIKGVVTAMGPSCRISSPVTLSTRIQPGLGIPGGTDYDPATGRFAVMSKPLRLSSPDTGSGCDMVLSQKPLVFLTGSMKLPGGVPIPTS